MAKMSFPHSLNTINLTGFNRERARSMMRFGLKVGPCLRYIAASLGLACGGLYAAPASYGFTFGLDNGDVGSGSFTVNSAACPSFVCTGTFTPANSLLSFNVSIDGSSFAADNDDGYPNTPDVTLSANQLVGLDFFDSLGAGALSLSLSGGVANGIYIDPQGDLSLVTSIAAVPEPASALLVLLGLGAVGAWRLRTARSTTI